MQPQRFRDALLVHQVTARQPVAAGAGCVEALQADAAGPSGMIRKSSMLPLKSRVSREPWDELRSNKHRLEPGCE